MPPLPQSRLEVYQFYKMQFMRDGYPGKRTRNGLVAHPILGAYVIRDYVRHFNRSGDRTYLDAAVKVADAAIARMVPFRGGLVFQYTDEMGLTSKGGTFYSGLTQSRYLLPLAGLWKASGEQRFLDAAERMLSSLEVPVAEGGVARAVGDGLVIEEYPDSEIGHYTLNGWTTTMVVLAHYAELAGSERARTLLRRNVAALKVLLPLYDMPDMANSRYRLTGSTLLKLEADAPVSFVSGRVVVPGEGAFDIRRDTTDPWHNFVERAHRGVRALRVNIVMSRISHPAQNEVHLRIAAATATQAKVSIETGEYDIRNNRPGNRSFRALTSVSLAPGDNDVVISVPWDAVPLVAYPTNFGKKIGDSYYNVYHFIHVRNLEQLYGHTREPVLRDYALRWKAYAERWPAMPIYLEPDTVLHAYRAGAKRRPA